jgi:outer membrane protein
MSVDLCTRFSLIALFLGAATNTANVSLAFSSSEVTPMPTKQYVLDWGVGAVFKPKYPGADSYLLYPFPIIAIGRFYVPGLGQVVDGEEVVRGFYFYPSFDFNGERKPSDSPDLTGTNKVDWALELGMGAGYRYDWLRGFVELRQGINGHEGQVAEFGMDFIFNPAARIELIFGPRASWASENYMNTYFGVTPAEAAAPGSSLSAFDASSSFKTVGLAMRANYSWSENTTFHLQGGWDRFVGDAAESPIVKAGSSDQFSIGLGASYRFAFDLFD